MTRSLKTAGLHFSIFFNNHKQVSDLPPAIIARMRAATPHRLPTVLTFMVLMVAHGFNRG